MMPSSIQAVASFSPRRPFNVSQREADAEGQDLAAAIFKFVSSVPYERKVKEVKRGVDRGLRSPTAGSPFRPEQGVTAPVGLDLDERTGATKCSLRSQPGAPHGVPNFGPAACVPTK